MREGGQLSSRGQCLRGGPTGESVVGCPDAAGARWSFLKLRVRRFDTSVTGLNLSCWEVSTSFWKLYVRDFFLAPSGIGRIQFLVVVGFLQAIS